MALERSIQRYRNCYAKLLRLYPSAYFNRFGEGMQQTFSDLLRERARTGKGLFGYALWMFTETTAGILRENLMLALMRYKNIIRLAAIVGCILMIPFLRGAPWDETDYIVAGVLLFGTGLAYELVARKAGTFAYRVAVAMALGASLLLIWINLAVGLIGSEENPANLMYGGVLAIGMLGALITRFQAAGMARTLFTMAVAQALVPLIALLIWRPPFTAGVVGVFVLNGIFVALFVGSGFLFKRSVNKVDTVS